MQFNDQAPEELYSQIKDNKMSQRQKRFIIQALKEQGFKVKKQQKKWVQRNRGKLPFKPSDLPRIFENMDNLNVRMASLVALVTGTRRAETVEILKKNIDLEECRIRLEITKKGVPQDVYFPQSFAPLLRKWCHYTRDSPFLLPHRLTPNKPICLASLNSGLSKALKKAGMAEAMYVKENGHTVQKYGFHSFRKFFCSMLVNNGVKPEVARILMRHEKVELTLKVYTHLGRKTLNQAMERIDPMSSFGLKEPRQQDTPKTPQIGQQFANQSILLFNDYRNGKINKEEYEQSKQELISLQKVFDNHTNNEIQ
ncbi:MAG: tyrosine-type recombinase/integrase [archaeon]